MGSCSAPIIRAPTAEEAAKGTFMRVAFEPDLGRFKVKGKIPKDALGLMRRRVVDVAASCPGVTVTLDGVDVSLASFDDYVRMFETSGAAHVSCRPHKRWDVAVGPSDVGGFAHLSLVNGVATHNGGTHVTYVVQQVYNAVAAHVKKEKGFEVGPQQIRPHLSVFVRGTVENPVFDSQAKETLTSAPDTFGSLPDLPPKFLKRVIAETALVEKVVAACMRREDGLISKAAMSVPKATADFVGGRRLLIPKLEDAIYAGDKTRSSECTLILTEGDSAKASAMAGIAVLGRETWGVFPLRGKLLNVRAASSKAVSENAEVMNLMMILGLNPKKPDALRPRYGRLLLMCDQDVDGSHIKGLVVNLLHKYWPDLLRRNDFLQMFNTPLLKVQ
jgi:DNA topoisomerase-2